MTNENRCPHVESNNPMDYVECALAVETFNASLNTKGDIFK